MPTSCIGPSQQNNSDDTTISSPTMARSSSSIFATALAVVLALSSPGDVRSFVFPTASFHAAAASAASRSKWPQQRTWRRKEVAFINDGDTPQREIISWIRANSRIYQSTVVEANNDTQTNAHDQEDLLATRSMWSTNNSLTPSFVESSNSQGSFQIIYQDQEYDDLTHHDESDEDDEYTEPDDRHDDDVEILVDHFLGSFFGSGGESEDGNCDNTNNPSSRDGSSEDSKGRAHVIAPSGVGKTLLSMQTLTTLYSQSPTQMKTAILVGPTLEIVDQTLEECDEYGVFRDIPHERMIVSSRTSRKEPCTTDPEIIAKFLSSSSPNPPETLKFLVCTYNSLPKVAEAMGIVANRENGGDNPVIDFAIFDEAHRMEGCSKMYGYGLDDDNISIHNRLFLSATPNNYTEEVEQVEIFASKMAKDGSRDSIGRRTGNFVEARSFFHKELFGPCLVHYTEQECVDRNITVSKSICVLDPAEVEALVGRKLNPSFSREEFLPFAIKAAYVKLNVTKGLSFHSTNVRAEEFVGFAADVFSDDISLHRVDGKMTIPLREQILKEALSKPKSLIANCDLYREGKDVPEWNLVIMADAVKSRTKAKQIIGRVSRAHPGKQKGYILLPIFVESEEDLEANGGAGYDMFVSAFQAMIANDPELQSAVNFIIGEGSRLGYPLPVEEYPERVLEAFIMPKSMPVKEVNKVMRRLVVEYDVRYLDRKWKKMYELLKSYWEEHGHCLVPQEEIWKGKPLGKWVGRQRQAYRNGGMLSGRKVLLDELGFVWEVRNERWQFMYNLLVQYKNREGNCLVPKEYKEDGENLGRWVNNQRFEYRIGKLSSHRKQLLEELGFAWSAVDAQWEQMYNLLVQYKNRVGDCLVPREYKEGGEALGRWVDKQRTEYTNGKITSHRKQLLEEVGFVWNAFDAQWERMFKLLLQYKNRVGDCHVSQGHKEDGENLSKWLNSQRREIKKGTLDPSRQQRLEDAGVEWDGLRIKAAKEAALWDSNFAVLEKFVAREGHCNVKQKYVCEETGVKLGIWLNNQKQKWKKGKLYPERYKRLKELGIVW